jgi:hypothetical protein
MQQVHIISFAVTGEGDKGGGLFDPYVDVVLASGDLRASVQVRGEVQDAVTS